MKRMLKIVAAIAVVATAGAAWLGLYLTYSYNNTPFQPMISFGTPILSQLETTSEDNRSDDYVAVILQIIIANKGAASGCIYDLALTIGPKLSNSTGIRVHYPAFYIDATKYLRGWEKNFHPFTQ